MKKENMLAAMMFGGQAGGGGGSADTFVVKAEEKLAQDGLSYTYTFDHTAEEAWEAVADGKCVRLIIVNEYGFPVGEAEQCGDSTSLIRIGTQTIASTDAPRKATGFMYGNLSWQYDTSTNYLIPSVNNDQRAYCPMIYNGSGSGIVGGQWHYYLDLSSLFENYVLNIEAASSFSPDGQAYLTASIPDGVSPYEDLSWLISKVYSEFVAGDAHTSWFRLTTSSEITAPVTMIGKNQFTMTFTDVQPLLGGTADIFDVTINLCASTNPDVVSVTFGAKHHTSTAYVPS